MQEYTDEELREIAKEAVELGYAEWFHNKDGDLSFRLTPEGKKFGKSLLKQQAYKNN